MRKMVRAPLTWMIVAECVVVGALLLVAWHVIAGVAAPGSAAPLTFPALEAAPADTALPAGGAPPVGPSHGPPPRVDVGRGLRQLGHARLDQVPAKHRTKYQRRLPGGRVAD